MAQINLLRNAADASLITGGGVRIGWTRNGSHVEVAIEDDGPGISNTTNLFVPFFTTMPGGSGMGLVLSRQIAEAHGELEPHGPRRLRSTPAAAGVSGAGNPACRRAFRAPKPAAEAVDLRLDHLFSQDSGYSSLHEC